MYTLSGGHDRMIRLVNVASFSQVAVFEGHAWEVFALSVSHDGQSFSSAGGDRAVFLWDVASRRIVRKFTGHHQRVNSVAFGTDSSGSSSTLLASASYDRSVRLWDIRATGKYPVQVLEDAKDSVSSVKVASYYILSGSIDGHVRCYDVRMGQMLSDNVQHPVTSVSFLGDASSYLVSSLDSTIRLFDLESGSLLSQYTGHENTKYQITSTSIDNDATICGGSENGEVFCWDLVSQNQFQSTKAHAKSVTAVSAHEGKGKDGRLVSTSLDGSLALWSYTKTDL